MRQAEALCADCMAFTSWDEDCLCPACPLYETRPANQLEPIRWWTWPKFQWKAAAQAARTGKELPEKIHRPAPPGAAARLRRLRKARKKRSSEAG